MKQPWIITAAALLLPVPLGATPASRQQIQAKVGGADEKVCEDIVMTGSRIASKRVCMTRAQWEERRRDDRDAIEKGQRSANVGCSVINTHSPTPGC